MVSFILGLSKAEHVLVTVNNYERSISGEYYDDNWVSTDISVSAGAFSGHFNAAFLTEDFVQFNVKLQSLFEVLKGEAVFSTMEEQLSLKVFGNSRGSIEVEGVALDQVGIGNKLQFRFKLDQTYLSETIKGLNEVIAAFPVRGE